MIETKRISLTEVKSVKTDDNSMVFSGYGAVFDNIDSYDDIIVKGAFTETLKSIRKSGKWPAMLSQHGGGWFGSAQDNTPVGIWTDMKEDDHGLYVEGKLADTDRGRELYTLMKMEPRPAIDGLSIGYRVNDSAEEVRDKKTVRLLKSIDLVEVSIVSFPANTEARVHDIKSIPTIRDAEDALRDAGFSRSQAKEILAKGYKLSLRDAEDSESNEELADLIKGNIAILRRSNHVRGN